MAAETSVNSWAYFLSNLFSQAARITSAVVYGAAIVLAALLVSAVFLLSSVIGKMQAVEANAKGAKDLVLFVQEIARQSGAVAYMHSEYNYTKNELFSCELDRNFQNSQIQDLEFQLKLKNAALGKH